MRAALDTNILARVEGVDGDVPRIAAIEVLRRLPESATVVPTQALGELFNVLVRKAGRSRDDARATLRSWRDVFDEAPTSSSVMERAADLAADHRLGIWDAVILSAASEAGCRLLLSEDLQDGFTWGGVTVTNPFVEPLHPLLDALMGDEKR